MRTHGSAFTVREGLADVLTAYLAQAGRKPFAWGELDCFLFAADWIERVTGIDPSGEYRGAYTNAREARNLMQREGGAVSFVHALMRRAGLSPTVEPVLGDVALVRAAFVRHRARIILVPVGAIFVREKMWAIKSAGASSITIGDFPVMQAWSLH